MVLLKVISVDVHPAEWLALSKDEQVQRIGFSRAIRKLINDRYQADLSAIAQGLELNWPVEVDTVKAAHVEVSRKEFQVLKARRIPVRINVTEEEYLAWGRLANLRGLSLNELVRYTIAVTRLKAIHRILQENSDQLTPFTYPLTMPYLVSPTLPGGDLKCRPL